MDGLRIAGHDLSVHAAADIIARYPVRSVLLYDLGGRADKEPFPADGVTLEDIGRMTVINARLSGDDVVALTDSAVEAPWGDVPHRARLEDVTDPEADDGLAGAMWRLHSHFTARDSIKQAKASKLLHLKRPWLYPVLDRFVRGLYADGEADPERRARISKPETPALWAAIADDLGKGADALIAVRGELASRHGLEVFGRLPLLRLIDIIAWSVASEGRA